MRKAGRKMASHFKSQATAIIASAFIPPDEDEVVVDFSGMGAGPETMRVMVEERIAEAMGSQGVSFDVHGVFTEDLLRFTGTRPSIAVDLELRKLYRSTIQEAAEEGWSIPTTATAIIEKVDATAAFRAEALARTDLIGLTNGATQAVATEAFAGRDDVTKIWLSTDDDRTRESHVDADGQEVPLKQPFHVGGFPLRFPGDPVGPDEEIINCRCTILYGRLKIEDDEKFDIDTLQPSTPAIHDAEYALNNNGVRSMAANEMTDLDEFRAAVEDKLRNDLSQQSIKIRRSNDTAIRIARSLDGRFKSQFETGTSGGALTPEGRSSFETRMFGYARDLPPVERPIYGYVGGVTDEAGVVQSYGQVGFVFKKGVRARTTFTTNDSLGSTMVPSPINKPSSRSVFWSTSFPLKLEEDLRNWSNLYFEAQMHGGVSLDDVELIEIWYGNPGEREIAQRTADKLREALAATNRNIPIELRPEGPFRTGRGASFADDRLGVEAGGRIPPAATGEDALHGQLVEDAVALGVVDTDDGVILSSSTSDEEHVGVATLDGDNSHPSDYTSTDWSVVMPGAYASTDMPWHVEQGHVECGASRPFAVVRDGNGTVEGCHASRASANRQMAALYAQEENRAVTASTITVTVTDGDPAEAERVPWEGILAIAGKATSDRRYLLPGEIGHRDLPLPLAPSHDSQHASETVGRIEAIEHIPAAEFEQEGWELAPDLPPQAVVIWGTGTFDGSEEAEDARRALENGVGVSLDLPMERTALIDAATYEEVDPSSLSGDEILGLALGSIPEGYLHGIAGKIGGLSLASIAAFEETTIRVVDNATALVASGYEIHKAHNPNFWVDIRPVLASAAPLAPPRDWFFMDEPDEPTPLTVTPDGRVYGHVALWNTCHAGRSNGSFSSCMYAPHSPSRYKQFHLGSILCDDGAEAAIGKITVGTGHAALHLGAAAARRHYDNTGSCGAFVRAADGVFGIWVCGAVRSDAPDEMIRDMRACPPSGDWRAVDHSLELQAILAVNVPGYVVPRSQLSLAASADSLEVATLILGSPDSEDYAEALRAEIDGVAEEDIAMLVELSVPMPR